MSYKVEIIADSIGPANVRLTTFALMYPRMVHADLMTHRTFSRNASSSRAIPAKRMIDWVEEDTARPAHWGKNQSGMQAREDLGANKKLAAQIEWSMASEDAIRHARAMADIGVHKQIVNRMTEAYGHINTLVTSTDFGNWFALRLIPDASHDHADADPTLQALAIRMLRAYLAAEPKRVERGYWHLPYVTDKERGRFSIDEQRATSVARCCRVSYKTFDDKVSDIADDMDLADRLMKDGHWSPFEHQALCYSENPNYRSGNFHGGWTQYRQMLPKSKHSPSRQDLEAIAAKYGDRDYLV